MSEAHQQLLLSLKSVVEGLLCSQVPNVWSIYGGLSRLRVVLQQILKHEIKLFKANGEEDVAAFIEGLNWLQPNLAASLSDLPASDSDRAIAWLNDSLESHNLSEKLSWLVSDEQHLNTCYNAEAFIRQPEYMEGALICLRAIEQNQMSLLIDIHPSLYLPGRKDKGKVHRRCSSLPEGIKGGLGTPRAWVAPPIMEVDGKTKGGLPGRTPIRLRRWKSLPNMQELPKSLPHQTVSKTVPSSPAPKTSVRPPPPSPELSPSILKINYRDTCPITSPSPVKTWSRRKASRSNSAKSLGDRIHRRQSIAKQESVELSSHNNHVAPDSTDTETEMTVLARQPACKRLMKSSSSMESTPEEKGRVKKKSFLEDGSRVQPMRLGFFPRPSKGQSLASFLSSNQFSLTSAEMDRENAHFNIAEVIIAAIEQVKCKQWESSVEDTVEDSDEEIRELKQRIRLRRREKQEERQRRHALMAAATRDHLYDTNTTDQSFSPLSSCSDGSSSDTLSTEGVDDMDIDQVTPSGLANLTESGLSMSMASLYSEADLSRPTSKNHESSDYLSAEGVALSLLRRFSDKHLPRASDMQWLVSEKDAPQQLLPMPNSWAVSPDDGEAEDMREATALRGTNVWAPPRPQIIFTLHPPVKRRTLLLKQNMQCAGCGMMVAPEYSNRFRYCDYLGKYFCTGCHSNKTSIIPARILSKWDFDKYPVSNFSHNLLEEIESDPVFYIKSTSLLYKKVRVMEKTRVLRIQLASVKDFVFTCRFAVELQNEFKSEPSHLLEDPEQYSLQDLLAIKSGVLLKKMLVLISQATTHVYSCELCKGRGFCCEICGSTEILFPWEVTKVSRCTKCGSCFHMTCYKKSKNKCLRCSRISARTMS